MGSIYQYGGYKICPVCGRKKWIDDFSLWRYKRTISWGKDPNRIYRTMYFHTWSCLRIYDADPKPYNEKVKAKNTPEEKPMSQKQIDNKAKQKRMEKTAKLREGKTCSDCRYEMKDIFGFPYCTYNYAARHDKPACGRFKPADVFTEEERDERRKECLSQVIVG